MQKARPSPIDERLGVGPLAALAYRATIDDPGRFISAWLPGAIDQAKLAFEDRSAGAVTSSRARRSMRRRIHC
jgi:hypothetical protein